MQLAHNPTQQVWFEEVCLWNEEPQPWWEQYPGLMAMYPLCRHSGDLVQAVTHAAAVIRHHEMDSVRRADLLTTLGIFGKLKDRSIDFLSLIGREQIRESPAYQEIMEEGEQVRARKYILEILGIRFGPKAVKEFEKAVNGLENLEQLSELLRIAAKSRRISQFRRALPKP